MFSIFFVLCFLICISFYFFILFFYNKENYFFLYFSLLLTTITINILFQNKFLLSLVNPNINPILVYKIKYLSFLMIFPLFFYYYYYFINEEINNIFIYLLNIILIIGIFSIVLLDKFPSYLDYFYSLLYLSCLLYIITDFIRLKTKIIDKVLFMSGIFFLIIAISGDFLYKIYFIDDKILNFYQTSFILFVISHSILLFNKFHRIYWKINILSKNIGVLENENKRWDELLIERAYKKLDLMFKSFNQFTQSILIIDNNGLVEYVNKRFLDTSGYKFKDIIGKKYEITTEYQLNDVIKNELTKNVEKGFEWKGELQYKNDDTKWDFVNIIPITINNNFVSHILIVKEDISEKKKIENELNKEKIRLLLRNLELEQQMDMAKSIQKKLLPLVNPFPFISYLYKPMDKIGGDFFDFVRFRNPNIIGIFLSDVSGHGVPAALITSMIKSLLSQSGPRRESPSEIMCFLNESIIDQTFENFITAFYGVINLEELTFSYCNAGHYSPVIIRDGKIENIVSSVKSPPLSVYDNQKLKEMNLLYQTDRISIQKNDKLFLFTDGLVEIKSLKNLNYLDLNDFYKIVLNNSKYNSKEFIDNLFQDLIEFRGSDKFDDDICMLCIEVL